MVHYADSGTAPAKPDANMRNVTSFSLVTLFFVTALGCSASDSAVLDSAPQEGNLGTVTGKASVESDISEQLKTLPDITSVEELAQDPSQPGYVEGTRKFLVKIRQPVDHENLGGPTFEQRFYLWHRSNTAPMIMYSGGYGLKYGNAQSELTPMLQGNQISIEYRYFQESTPNPKDYRYLTVKQSADDYHHLSTVLKRIYKEKWISTGRSKGGMTSIHYRTFYPDDVAGTVPMVAPLQTEFQPQRYAEWFRKLGQRFPECHARSTAFFREILKRREMIGKRMATNTRGFTYNRIPIQRVIEYSIKNWIFGTYMEPNPAVDCPAFLPPSVSDDELYRYIDQAGLTYSLSDQGIADYDFKEWIYQEVAELGSYTVDEEPYRDLLMYPGEYSLYEYLPPGVRPDYDPTAMRLALHWLKSEGERMFFVYGGSDSWSAAAVTYPGAFDSYKKWVNEGPVTGHRARISNLLPADQQLAIDRITTWGGSSGASPQSVDMASIAGHSADSEEIDPPLPGAVGFRRGQEPKRH